MKKLLAFLLAVLVISALEVSALAAVSTTDGTVELIDNSGLTDIKQEQTASMDVILNVEDSYKVTIPASIKLTGSGPATGTAKISITPNLSGKKVNILMMSNGWDDAKFYNGSEDVTGTSTVPITEADFIINDVTYSEDVSYRLTSNETMTWIPSRNGVLVNSASGTTESDSTLTFQADTSKLTAGNHNYTQTFIIYVE